MNLEQEFRKKIISFFVSCADEMMFTQLQEESRRRMKEIEGRFESRRIQIEKRYKALFSDVPYLISQGFKYEPKTDTFIGRMEGTTGKNYEIKIEIPDMYPSQPPLIFAEPLFKGEIPFHVQDGINGSVCVDAIRNPSEWRAQSYWKDGVNLKGALHLVQLALKQEIDRTKPREMPKEKSKTVIDKISEKTTRARFIKWLNGNGLEVKEDAGWNLIAKECAETTKEFKVKLINYERGLK